MTDSLILTFGFLVSLFLGRLIIPRILLVSHHKRLFDQPDNRKVHDLPVPRLGGLSFLPAMLIAFCLSLGVAVSLGVWNPEIAPPTAGAFLLLAVGSMLLFLTGLYDDLEGISYLGKFAVQIVASAMIVLAGVRLHSLGGLLGITELTPLAGQLLTVFLLVYIINAVNLIDGIDGLASGLGIIGLLVLMILEASAGHMAHALLASALLGVMATFWFYNVIGYSHHHHRLFMGDTGSMLLGYVLGFLTIHACSCDAFEADAGKTLIVAFTPLLIPLFDVVRVVFRRLRLGHHPFLPDRNHFHHKLLRTGLNVHQVLVVILSMDVLLIVLNYLLLMWVGMLWTLLADILLWVAMHLTFNWLIHRRPAA